MILKGNTAITQLEGKVALVTGAGRGLGFGIAKALGQAGVKVCATDVDEADMEASFQGIEMSGNQLLNLFLDVADPEMFDDVVHKVVDKWGRLDVLVHAAAIMPVISLENTSHEAWWHEIHIHLGGLFNGVKAVLDVMKAQGGGHVISVASRASFFAYPNGVAYCVGKHSQEAFRQIPGHRMGASQYSRQHHEPGNREADQADGDDPGGGGVGARRCESKLD